MRPWLPLYITGVGPRPQATWELYGGQEGQMPAMAQNMSIRRNVLHLQKLCQSLLSGYIVKRGVDRRWMGQTNSTTTQETPVCVLCETNGQQ